DRVRGLFRGRVRGDHSRATRTPPPRNRPHPRTNGDTMSMIYVRHDVTTIAEVNALALDEDQRENGAIVLYEGSTCYWSINWATRNEIPGRWYDNSSDGLRLVDGDEVTVLVPIEAEEETREHPTRDEERPGSAYLQPVQQVRYKTRWEAA